MFDKVIAQRAKNLIHAKKDNGIVLLDICGGVTPYSNKFNSVDILPDGNPDFMMDVSKGIDFPDNSIDEIVSIATLEHFEFKKFQFVLAEMVRVLKIGGKISISTPDVERISAFVMAKGFLENYEAVNQNLYALQRDPFDIHRVALSGRFILSYLERVGFGQVNPNDLSLNIRHDLELSCRVSAVKESMSRQTDWLSVYRNSDDVLALAKDDCVRFSCERKNIGFYLPDNFPLSGQKVSIEAFDQGLGEIDIYPGLTEFRLPQHPDLSYFDISFKFRTSVKPKAKGFGDDERDIAAFLILKEW